MVQKHSLKNPLETPPDPVSEILDELLREAVDKRATDVHIDPVPDGHWLRFRIDGQVVNQGIITPPRNRRLLQQVRIASALQVEHAFSPLEGQFQWKAPRDTKDIRVTLIPSRGADAVHMRILTPPEKRLDIRELGLGGAEVDKILHTLKLPQGLVLLCGPTGSGKTTTMYSLMTSLELERMIAVSIEDPVEYALSHVRQTDVDEDHGLTMYRGLRTLLRMDPDVIMIGEIRSSESAITAARASNAGRFVFTTIHARDTAAAVEALHYLKVPYSVIGGALRLVIAQNLIRLVCPHCAGRRKLREREVELFSRVSIPAPSRVPEAAGCERCHRLGYRGRTGIFEVMEIDPETGKRISQGISQQDLRRRFREKNPKTLVSDALYKVKDGLTTMEEVLRLYWPGASGDADPGEWAW
jgi:type II secretory ATPase GspE/PulE/Tfp pilus assembly ATPase PilB-like protein